MIKTKKGQTIQWTKQKKNRQYNDQNKGTDIAMIKIKEGQTIQWSKQKKNRQYNDQSKRRTDNAMI